MSARRVLATALALAAVLAVAGSGRELERRGRMRPAAEELLYLPNGKYLRVASLGHRAVLADAIYLWAIQFYGDYDRADRFRYVEHVFGNVIAELDPQYTDAYWVGALIMIVEAGDVDAGLRLLDLGIERNPDGWILPYLAGWECYYARRYVRAAEYFGRAAKAPGAPSRIRRARAGMFAKAEDFDLALREWAKIEEDPESDEATVAIARRQLRSLKIKADLARLQTAAERFRSDNRRSPRSVDELVQGAYIDAVPRDPEGRRYRYDPSSGRFTSDAEGVLKDHR